VPCSNRASASWTWEWGETGGEMLMNCPSWGEIIAFEWDLREKRAPRLYLPEVELPFH